jgi:hypothetical protein
MSVPTDTIQSQPNERTKMLPKQIVATKTVVYDVDFAFTLAKDNGIDTTNWQLADVIQMLEQEIIEDFGYNDDPVLEEIY